MTLNSHALLCKYMRFSIVSILVLRMDTRHLYRKNLTFGTSDMGSYAYSRCTSVGALSFFVGSCVTKCLSIWTGRGLVPRIHGDKLHGGKLFGYLVIHSISCHTVVYIASGSESTPF